MSSIATIAYWESVVLLVSFAAIVAWNLLTKNASLSGLLEGDRFDGSTVPFTAGRAQLLIFTTLFALYYLIQIFHSPTGFPSVPKAMLYVLGGSQATYLGGKSYDIVFRQVWEDFKKGNNP